MLLETITDFSNPPAMHKCLRLLGSFEGLLWQMDKRSPLHFTLAAHVDGVTTIHKWKEALEQTRQRHPLWSACITETNGGFPFFEQMQDPHVGFRVIKSITVEEWENEVARELCARFDTIAGPLVRAVLVHTELSSMLILSAHHSICDGMSLVFTIRDVLQTLSGSKLKTLALHSSEENSFGLQSLPRTHIQDAELWTGLQPVPTVYRSSCSVPPEVCSLQFSFGLTDALRARARQEGTTVHAALLAAAGIAARSNSSYASGRDLHLCSTINNRGLLDSPEDCCVLFTACDFPIAESTAEDFWDLARRSKKVLRSAQSEDGVRGVLGAVEAVAKAGLDDYSAGEAGGKLFKFDIHLSNLGLIEVPTVYGSISLRHLWGPGVLIGYEGEQTLGASTLNGHLCLLHTSHTPLPQFLEDIESLLGTATKQ